MSTNPPSQETHTPTPWRVAPSSSYAGDEINIDADERGFVALCGKRGDGEAEANANLIVQAVNSHSASQRRIKELETALRAILEDKNQVTVNQARAALQ